MLSLEERYLLRLCIARSMANDAKGFALPIAQCEDVRRVTNEMATPTAGSASALLINALLSFPTVAERLDSSEVQRAATLLKAENISQMVWNQSSESSGLKTSLASVLTNVLYGTALRSMASAEPSQGVATVDAPRAICRAIEMVAAAHSTTELPREAQAAIGYFQRKVVDRILEVARTPSQLHGLRVFLALVPQTLAESMLVYGTTTRAVEWLLDVLLKRRLLFGNHSILYHIIRQVQSSKAQKAHIAAQTARLSTADAERLKQLLQHAAPHMRRGGDPHEALPHVMRAYETVVASADSPELLHLLSTHIERLQTKALHRLIDSDALVDAIRKIAPALTGPLFDTLRASKALKPTLRASFALLRSVARDGLTAAPDASWRAHPDVVAAMEQAKAEGAAALVAAGEPDSASVASDDDGGSEVGSEAAHDEPTGGVAVSRALELPDLPAAVGGSMQALTDAIFLAAHEAASLRAEACVPFMHWLLHESFVFLASPEELERRIGIRSILEQLRNEQGDLAMNAALNMATKALSQTAVAHTNDKPRGVDTLSPFEVFEAVGTTASGALPEPLARMETIFDTRLKSLMLDLQQRQLQARDGMLGSKAVMKAAPNPTRSQAAPNAAAASGTVRPFVALEVACDGEGEHALRGRGYEHVCYEKERLELPGGATLWALRAPTDIDAEDVACLPPLAEVCLIKGRLATEELCKEGRGWVCIAHPLAIGMLSPSNDSCVRLWYRRCQRAQPEPPITSMAFASPRAHGGDARVAREASGLPANSVLLDQVDFGWGAGLLGATSNVITSMMHFATAYQFQPAGGALHLGYGHE